MEEKIEAKAKNPLGRSITLGCVIFIALLCILLGLTSHFYYKNSLYQRYESYITDILHYVDRHIDDDDLVNCIKTCERSAKYDELEAFMDAIKEDFTIHYLYIIKPLNKNPTGNVISVVSAENYYDRNIDTEGNLYLGWISDDEFELDAVNKFFEIMEKRDIVFFEEKTEWGVDYTGALTLFDSQKRPYALLAVDVDITEITKLIRTRTLEISVLIIFLGLIFTLAFLLWAKWNITKPIALLEEKVVDFAEKSHGQRDISLFVYTAPSIHTDNEVELLSNAVTQMTQDMKNYVENIIIAEKKAAEMQKQANQMSELANKDALTGIRNKTAYDNEIKKLEYELQTGSLTEFGIGMIDLNFLKKINDTYGHEQGNFAIQKLCHIVCHTFEHSPVFRIGGDEFVVVLKGSDYKDIESLISSFKEKLAQIAATDGLEPWEKVSAAIGVAFYDKKIDANVTNVFKRADQKMYECKKAMKALREE